MRIDDMVKNAGRRVGVEIARYRPPERRRQDLLDAHGIASVLDVGANTGQYGTVLRSAGFTGGILSFEPLPDAFAELEQTCAADPAWRCLNVAASDGPGHVTMNVAANSASSSLLAMTDRHVDAAPQSARIGTADVDLVRLDALDEVTSLPGPVLLKADVQGHEDAVLRGATGVLERVALLEVELSVVPLYDGAPSLLTMLAAVDALGFDLVALEPGFHDPRSGAVLQLDGMFVRRG